MKNPLLSSEIIGSDYKFPFDKIKTSHFIPAAKYWYKVTMDRIKKIRTEKQPTFDSIVLALEKSSLEFDTISAILCLLNIVQKTPDLMKVMKVMTTLEAKSSEWMYDSEIFKQVKKVYDSKPVLNEAENKLLKDLHDNLIKSGANLPLTKKNRLKKITKELGKLELTFGNNVLKDSKYEVWAKKDEVSGIPASTLKNARANALAKKKSGYLFTDFESDDVISYADNRSLRKQVYIRGRQIGLTKFKVEESVLKILKLRKEFSNLLGIKSYPEFVISDRMIKNTQDIYSVLNEVSSHAKLKAAEELDSLKLLAEKDGIKDFDRFDEFYYKNKLIESSLQVDLQKIKEYFPLPKVWTGLQETLTQFFQISFEKIKYPTYHKSVEAYAVLNESGEKIGTLLMDMFQRKNKEEGALCTDLAEPGFENLPTVAVVMNLSDKTNQLMAYDDVRTLFHEMGHAVHTLLTKVQFPAHVGVQMDFVELPSQFMENWVDDPEVISKISSHYKTGEPLPLIEVDKIKKIGNAFPGIGWTNQVFLAQIDLEMHGKINIKSLVKFEKELFNRIHIYPFMENTSTLANFGHIMDSGYDVGYYSYLWANILNKDAFLLCKSTGGINSPYLKHFKSLMERGGSISDAENYRRFKGSDPSIDAFLQLEGLK